MKNPAALPFLPNVVPMLCGQQVKSPEKQEKAACDDVKNKGGDNG